MAAKVKTPKAKATKHMKTYAGLDFIQANKTALLKTVALYTTAAAKHLFIRNLEKVKDLVHLRSKMDIDHCTCMLLLVMGPTL